MPATGTPRGWQARGTEVRSLRAALKRRIADGDVDAAALLEGTAGQADEEIALGVRIDHLLGAVPGVGPQTTRTICTNAGVDEGRRLAELTVKARRDIAEHLRKEIR